MKTLFFTFCFALLFSSVSGQMNPYTSPDTVIPMHEYKCGPPAIVGVFMMEAIIGGMSWYASKPKAWGDKVVGAQFGGGAAFMLGYIPFIWAGKEYKDHPEDRIYTTVICAGMAYGYSRVAYYNFVEANGATSRQRFGRNFLEMNLALAVPLTAAFVTDRLLDKRKHKDRKVGFMLTPNQVSIGMTF